MANLHTALVIDAEGNALGEIRKVEGEVKRLSGETKATGKAATDAGGKFRRFAQTSTGGLNKMRVGMVSLTGLVIGAFAGAAAGTREFVNHADRLSKLSDKLGVSVRALSEFEHVAELSGVSFASFSNGLQRMERNLSDAAKGTGEGKQAFEDLGISVKQLRALKPAEQFEVLAGAISKLRDPTDRVSAAMHIFGREGVDLLQTMTQGAAGIIKMRKESDQLGITINSKTAKAAARLDDSMTRLAASLKSIGTQIGMAVVPYLAQLATGMETRLRVIHTFSAAIKEAGAAVGTFVTDTIMFFSTLATRVLGYVSDMVDGIRDYFGHKLAGALDGVEGFFSAVADSAKQMYDDVIGHSWVPDMVQGIQTWFGRLDQYMTQPAQAATDDTSAAFAGLADAADTSLGDLRGSFRSAFVDVLTGARSFGGALKGVLSGLFDGLVDHVAGGLFDSLFSGGGDGGNGGGGSGGAVPGTISTALSIKSIASKVAGYFGIGAATADTGTTYAVAADPVLASYAFPAAGGGGTAAGGAAATGAGAFSGALAGAGLAAALLGVKSLNDRRFVKEGKRVARHLQEGIVSGSVDITKPVIDKFAVLGDSGRASFIKVGKGVDLAKEKVDSFLGYSFGEGVDKARDEILGLSGGPVADLQDKLAGLFNPDSARLLGDIGGLEKAANKTRHSGDLLGASQKQMDRAIQSGMRRAIAVIGQYGGALQAATAIAQQHGTTFAQVSAQVQAQAGAAGNSLTGLSSAYQKAGFSAAESGALATATLQQVGGAADAAGNRIAGMSARARSGLTGAAQSARDVAAAIASIQDRRINIETTYTEHRNYSGAPHHSNRTGGSLGLHATGGSFIVPGSGDRDLPFFIGLTPGERVDVTPRGQVNSGAHDGQLTRDLLVSNELLLGELVALRADVRASAARTAAPIVQAVTAAPRRQAAYQERR